VYLVVDELLLWRGIAAADLDLRVGGAVNLLGSDFLEISNAGASTLHRRQKVAIPGQGLVEIPLGLHDPVRLFRRDFIGTNHRYYYKPFI
jgi:hypothetical protein